MIVPEAVFFFFLSMALEVWTLSLSGSCLLLEGERKERGWMTSRLMKTLCLRRFESHVIVTLTDRQQISILASMHYKSTG